MDSVLSIIAVGCFGSFFQELLHWFHLRNFLPQSKYQKLLRSKGYWIITLLFILAAGPVTYFLLEEEFLQGELRAKIPFITGMTLPALVKKIIPNSDTELGAADEKMSFREVLNSYLS